jgi:competence protein ComEA
MILGAALVGAIAFGLTRRPSPLFLNVLPPQPTAIPAPTPTAGMVRFHIVGPVTAPGVYTLPTGALVQDALQAAGGPTADADVERLNLAEQIQDQQQIIVPRRMTVPTPRPEDVRTKGIEIDLLVDINTANSEMLQELPGIGPVLAGRIINYRDENGDFTDVEELTNVNGIGDKTMDKLRPLIIVGQ